MPARPAPRPARQPSEATSAEHGLEGGDVNGLRHVQVEAGGEGAAPVLGLTVACDRDEAHVPGRRVAARELGDRVAVEPGQAEVDQRHVGLERLQAGETLQKLRNYQLRLAVVCPPGSVTLSRRFEELMIEERREPHFGLFDTREEALAWLAAPGA